MKWKTIPATKDDHRLYGNSVIVDECDNSVFDGVSENGEITWVNDVAIAIVKAHNEYIDMALDSQKKAIEKALR